MIGLLPLLAAGCLNMDQTITLNKDGSVAIETTYALSEKAITQFRAMYRLRDRMKTVAEGGAIDEEDAGRPPALLDPVEERLTRELDKYKPYGLTVDKLKIRSRNAWREVQLAVRIDNLEEFAKTDFFKTYGFELARTTDGNYVLSRTREVEKPKLQRNDPETQKLISSVLSGFKATVRVNTPGRVLRTNGDRTSLFGVTWVFNFERNPDALWAAENQSMIILFEGDDDIYLPEISLGAKADLSTARGPS